MATQNIPSELTLSTKEVPYFSEWFGEWCIEYRALDNLVLAVTKLDLASHLAAVGDRPSESDQMRNRQDSQGVAIVSIEGVMQKQASSMSSGMGSTVLARRAIRSAAADPNIGCIMLRVSSPGGTSAGTQELYDDVAKAATQKPVFGFCDDLCASAGYWAISPTKKIFANEAALVGSIGTYAVVQDLSQAAEKDGVKVHVVKAGAFKGTGIAGTQVTEEQLSDIQRTVNSRNEFFLRGVASGRKMSTAQVQAVADGRVHSAAEAVSLGLIDQVATFDQAFEEAKAAAADYFTSKSKPKGTRMSTEPIEKTFATAGELRAACPGATSDFILKCIETPTTLADAAQQWSKELSTANATLLAENASLVEANSALKTEVAGLKSQLEEASKLPMGRVGVPAMETPKSSTQSSGGTTYWGKVNELVQSGKTKPQAMSAVNREFPELRQALIAETNSK